MVGHDLPVVGAVGVGRSVERGARLLQRMEVAAVVMLRALEHQVLEEVREAGTAGHLVLGADVVPDVDGDDRQRVIFVDEDVEAVGECVLVYEMSMVSRPGHDARVRGGDRPRRGAGR